MRQWLAALVPFVTSAVLHVVIGGSLAAATLFVAKKLVAPEPVEVELVVTPRKKAPAPAQPDPAALPEPTAETPPERPPPPRRREAPKPQRTLVEPPSTAPPNRADRVAAAPIEAPVRSNEPIREGPAAPPVFGLAMDSAETGGGTFAVPVGNTLRVSPSERGPVRGPRGQPPPSGLVAPPQRKRVPPPAAALRITRWPAREDERLFAYPELARRKGIEGKVELRLVIDTEGKVADAHLAAPGEKVLDDFALAHVRELRFSPARAGDEAVACEIAFTFTFILD